jgi:hypothetical protein
MPWIAAQLPTNLLFAANSSSGSSPFSIPFILAANDSVKFTSGLDLTTWGYNTKTSLEISSGVIPEPSKELPENWTPPQKFPFARA